MTFLYSLLLVPQSFALLFTFPSNFGGKTDFSDRAWKELMQQLFPEVKVGQPPTAELNIAEEATCVHEIEACSTTYFGKDFVLTQPDSVQLWVKWHQDATPFTCNKPEGCGIISVNAVADLTSQSNGWNVIASINVIGETNNDSPAVIGEPVAQLSFQHSEVMITPKTMASTKTLNTRCFHNYTCYIHTGTLMMSINGKCDSKPVVVCDRRYFPCQDFHYSKRGLCSQWYKFTEKHCENGVSKPEIEDCSLTVAVTRDNGLPMSYLIFEQKPLSGTRTITRRDYFEPDSPFGELPDGSSGVWMEWSPQAQ